MTDDFRIEDLLFQSEKRVVFRAIGQDNIPCTITRLKYSREILDKLSRTRFARSLVELKGHSVQCLRPVIGGGLDPVDHAPWIATVIWDGVSLQERLEKGEITPEVCCRVETNVRATIQALGLEAGDLSFDPRDIVATVAEDGQTVESFTVDYYKWFYDWATGKAVGSRRDPEEELSKLLDVLDPSRKARLKIQSSGQTGPTLVTPAKIVPQAPTVVKKRALPASIAGTQTPAATVPAAGTPAAGAVAQPVVAQPAVVPQPGTTLPASPSPQPPVVPQPPPTSKLPGAVIAVPPPVGTGPLIVATPGVAVPQPPITAPVITDPPITGPPITGPPITGNLIPQPPITGPPITGQMGLGTPLPKPPAMLIAGGGGTGSVVSTAGSPAPVALPASNPNANNNKSGIIIGSLVGCLGLLIGLLFWVTGKDDGNKGQAANSASPRAATVPPASSKRKGPPISAAGPSNPVRRTPVAPATPVEVPGAGEAQMMSEIQGTDDAATAGAFTLADEDRMRGMDGLTATLVGKIKEVRTHGKNTYLKFKLRKPQVAAGVELARATEGLDMDYLKSLDGKTIEIFGTVKIEGNQRLVIFFSKKSAIKIVE